MIVDCHVHLNDYTNDRVPTEESLQKLLADMKSNGVAKAFILTSYLANEQRPRIDRVLDLVKPHPELFVVEGISLSGGAPFDLRATEERLRQGLTIGLKLYPGYEHYYPTDRLCEPIYDLAAKYRVPVMFHTGDTFTKIGKLKYSHPLHLDDVAVDHPDLKIVICHLGNPWFRDTAELIYKNDNVRADISGLILGNFEARFERWLADQVRDLILYAGDPEDLLFGTDWPLVAMSPYIRFVRSLDLDEDEERRLLSGNAIEWFDLDRHEKRRASR
ncbi:MAG TPA: amidohydrolase family protein [Candidatus Thermoplasmatota archaeon]|nr:amidohydrolase family protein [Candidatus Thermoplasmatota archaeon]